ncbi:MAG TPA: glycosyltransferase [Actinomycetota bacterium]|nr:glycosyltransferase [Actinomycetota bacterium]
MSRRIALISDHASPLAPLGGIDAGGQNLYVAEVAKHLAGLGHQVDVFTRRDSDVLPETAEWVDGVRIVHVPAGPIGPLPKEELLAHMDEFTNFVLRFCRRQAHPYDLVHANFFMSGLVACELKRVLGIPFVVTFHALGRVRRRHQGDADSFPDERFEIEDRIICEADRIVAECPQEEEDLIRSYHADACRISIVPAGFDPSELWPIGKELARAALGLSPKEPVILHVGRLVPRKGVDNLIRGFAILRRKHGIEARLVIVGGAESEEEERSRLESIAAAEGVMEHVLFAGARPREALRWYYSAADVFVTTPWYEPFGITPLEAMACGTPVVGANVGGIKFTVRDGETGYLVEPNGPGALAERIHHIYRHPALRQALGRQSLDRANHLFTWKMVTARLESLYDEVISASRGAPFGNEIAIIDRNFQGALQALSDSRLRLRSATLDAAQLMHDCLARSGKVLVCGNGGSAADSQHFAAELVGRFRNAERSALGVMALNSDTSVLTACGNDFGFERIFSRQVEAFGRPGDVLVALTTSGRSQNVIEALRAARGLGMSCVVLSGGDGGEAAELADVAVVVPSEDTQRIQETHLVLIHSLCEIVEERLWSSRAERSEVALALTTGHRLSSVPNGVEARSVERG